MGKIKHISKYKPSILQSTLDFSAARSVSLASEYAYEHAFLRSLVVGLGIFFIAYLYLVGASVFNVVARKEAVTEVQKLQTSIASLQQEHFALSHAVDSEIAASMGLSEIDTTEYVYTPGNAAAVTMGGNGL